MKNERDILEEELKIFQGELSSMFSCTIETTHALAKKYFECKNKREQILYEETFLRGNSNLDRKAWFIKEVFSLGGTEAVGKMIQGILARQVFSNNPHDASRDHIKNGSGWIITTLLTARFSEKLTGVFLQYLSILPVDEADTRHERLFMEDRLTDIQKEIFFDWMVEKSTTGEALEHFIHNMLHARPEQYSIPGPEHFIRGIERLINICKNPERLKQVYLNIIYYDLIQITPKTRIKLAEKIVDFGRSGEDILAVLWYGKIPRKLQARAVKKLLTGDHRGEYIAKFLIKMKFGYGDFSAQEKESLFNSLLLNPMAEKSLLELWRDGELPEKQSEFLAARLLEFSREDSSGLATAFDKEKIREKDVRLLEAVWEDGLWKNNPQRWFIIMLGYREHFDMVEIISSFINAVRKRDLTMTVTNALNLFELLEGLLEDDSREREKTLTVIKRFLKKFCGKILEGPDKKVQKAAQSLLSVIAILETEKQEPNGSVDIGMVI